MTDYLGKEVKVGDIVVGCYSSRYNEFITQKVVKITAKTIQVKPANEEECHCLRPQERYFCNQFIIIEK